MTNIDKTLPGTPAWTDLMSDDPVAAQKFYASLFDWTFEVGPPESGPYTICFKKGRRVAGIGKKPPGQPMPTVWSMYLTVENADATAAKIKEAGGNVVMGPMDVFDQGRMAFAMDPTGAMFGMWQPMSHTGHQIINEPGAFAWTELLTRDLEKASAFYSRVFGYETVNMDGLPYVTLHLGPDKKTVAGGIMQMTDDRFPKEVPAHWSVYFATDDTDASARKVEALGGKVIAPAFDTDYGRIAVVQDAQAAVFSLIKLSPKALG